MTDFGERRRVLPKTGQTTSYRDGDDGYFQKGWFDGPRFKDVGDGTIVDNATGLMWGKDANGDTGYGGQVNLWAFAIDYATALSFAGYTGWRLPNVFELMSLLDYELPSLTFNTIIQNTGGKGFWTSTTNAGVTADAWFWENRQQCFTVIQKTLIYYFFCCRDA